VEANKSRSTVERVEILEDSIRGTVEIVEIMEVLDIMGAATVEVMARLES
jgi:hypothetical protein